MGLTETVGPMARTPDRWPRTLEGLLPALAGSPRTVERAARTLEHLPETVERWRQKLTGLRQKVELLD